MKRTRIIRIIAIVLMLITGLNAVVAGILFIISPSGNMMGMTTDYLKYSPFTNFFIPGLVLFTVNGLLNFYTTYLTWKKLPKYALYIVAQGILLVGWIGVQVIMVKDFNMLHEVMGSIGLALMILGSVLIFSQENTANPD